MANIETLLADTRYWVDQGSDPAAPSAGQVKSYTKSGKLYLRNSTRIVGPHLDETDHDLLDHTGLTGVGAPAFAGVKVYKAASQSINDSTFTTLLWDAEDFDTDGFHSTSSNTDRLTVPAGKGGTYVPFINLSFGGDLDGYRDFQICKNGTTIVVARHRQPGHLSDNNVALTFQPVSLVATDYLIARFFHTAGAALTVYGDNDFASEVYAPRFGMIKVG